MLSLLGDIEGDETGDRHCGTIGERDEDGLAAECTGWLGGRCSEGGRRLRCLRLCLRGGDSAVSTLGKVWVSAIATAYEGGGSP